MINFLPIDDAHNIIVVLFVHVEAVQHHKVSIFGHKTKAYPVITTTIISH